ncbi:hypothetical protein PR002_g9960 [Phytophthora rubi]|uniref:Secreted protein n=1 Tax=Phytophthora rubi TaxID=129364 RepID=A0A6A3MEY7_9STRA|nr:hypothetical protein PR002_g9960 [Phytophthora rubi]
MHNCNATICCYRFILWLSYAFMSVPTKPPKLETQSSHGISLNLCRYHWSGSTMPGHLCVHTRESTSRAARETPTPGVPRA